jgi:hypothetical protein
MQIEFIRRTQSCGIEIGDIAKTITECSSSLSQNDELNQLFFVLRHKRKNLRQA